MSGAQAERHQGGAGAPPDLSASPRALRWLIGLRLLVISTLFMGVLIIQAGAQEVFPLGSYYGLFLVTYGLSLLYLVLHLKNVSTGLQLVVQLLGDIGIITGFVYATGGLFSPFSFLYLTVIVEASVFLRKWGYLFAGLSAVAYGVIVDLMFFDILPVTPNLVGGALPSNIRVLYQLMAHVVGFILLTFLVTRLAESHRRLEAERERSRQYQALTDHVVRSVGSGILATDLDGLMMHLNPAGARMLHVADPEAIVGSAVEEVMQLEEHSWQRLREAARVNSAIRIEGHIESLETWLGLSMGPLSDERDQTVGFVINFQDLSEIARETERRRQQERMAAVGEMASRMAHEIKNPLASISGSAQMLASIGGLDHTASRLLGIVVDESRRLSGILDGFLEYTRPRSAPEQPCDLAAMLRDCVNLLERSSEVREHHVIRLECPSRLMARGHEDQLRQVFWNLSRNAIQAMPEGGELRIEARAAIAGVVLQWIDNGTGMDEEVRHQAFEPFVTTKPGGSGLGLAVVYAVIQDHGGSIEIDSTPGQGTTVAVQLPDEGDKL